MQNLKDVFNGTILVSHGGAAAGTGAMINYEKYGYENISKKTWEFVKTYNLEGVDIDYEHSRFKNRRFKSSRV